MRISIPVDEKNMETKICISFGRAPYFLIHDTETKENEFIVNSAATSTGGAGIKAAQIVIDSKVDALLSPRCGKNASDVLQAYGIKIYKTFGVSVKDNIDAFIAGKLPVLDEIHAGFHGHGGK